MRARRARAAAAILSLAAAAFGACRGSPYAPYVPSAEEVEWDAHHEAERQGRAAEAEAGYRSMCRADPPYPRACFDLARLLFEEDRAAEAREAALAAVERFPGDALVMPAIKRLGRSYRAAGELEAGAARLERLAGEIAGTDGWDTAVFEVARMHEARGDLEAEAEALSRIAALDRWDSQLWNDAVWRLADIRREQGDAAAERALLEAMIDTRESSWILGSYRWRKHDEALLRLGRLRLDAGDPRGALELFEALVEREESRLRDDGLLWSARARIAQGRRDEACRLLERHLRDFPDASSRRAAQALSLETGC